MSLREYHKKRDFKRTAEPKGAVKKSQRHRGGKFVIQKHAASRLHYDFRLEMNGVLASWAVPKGPSLDPAEKRLAVQVEDHPLDYGAFEGTIPQGEYGGGTVMVWDYGTWKPQEGEDASDVYGAGKLKFILHGKKLNGGWTLVRMRGGKYGDGKANWLLIKERDENARPLADGDILEESPNSAKTGRTMDEIAAGRKRVWHSNKPAKSRTAGSTLKARIVARAKQLAKSKSIYRSRNGRARRSSAGKIVNLADLDGARRAAMPRALEPQLATLVRKPPDGDQWLHEMKFDGYRMLCRLSKGKPQFVSRNGQDWTARLHWLIEPMAAFPAERAIIDGEVVVFDDHGVSNFQALQNVFRGENGRAPVYCVFDLIYLDGYNLTNVPLEDRKSVLADLLAEMPKSTHARVRHSDHVAGSGGEFYRQMCKAGLEGMISKRRDTPYLPGRSGTWLKSKCRLGQEMVIGGYSRPKGSRVGFGALLVGYFEPKGKFVYGGRVGTGFNDKTLNDLLRRLDKLKQPRSPFAQMPPGVRKSDVTWVRPELVAQLEFGNWTDEGLLRQAAFLGLREDKPARQVTREKTSPLPR